MIEDLYTTTKQDEQEVIVQLAQKSHPVFEAHFPGNPILPGFIQIEIIARILKDDIVAIRYSKFLSSIFPADTIVYRIQKEGKKRSIKIFKDSKKVSEIAYESK